MQRFKKDVNPDILTFYLKDQRNQPLGLSVTFTRKFLKGSDAQAFLRLEKLLSKDGKVELGVRIPF